MLELELYVYIALFGLAGGFLAGLLGIGGGLLYIIVLPTIAERLFVPEVQIAQFTIANSLFATMLASATAVYTHFRNGNFFWRESMLIGFSAILSSSLIIVFIVNQPFYSTKIFNWMLIVILIYMASITLFRLFSNSASPLNNKLGSGPSLLIGTSGGITAPLTGLGGSLVMIPLMVNWRHIDMKKAAVVANGVVFIQSLSSSVINTFFSPNAHSVIKLQTGFILWPVAAVLGISVVISSPLGAIWSRKLPSRKLSIGFLVLLIGVLFKKILEVL
jgi:uncharacterized membrane protein YfcA